MKEEEEVRQLPIGSVKLSLSYGEPNTNSIAINQFIYHPTVRSKSLPK